jgi:L-2-hydroxyglutarate oxidase LhgO
MLELDALVIGAGVVGLAVARQLALDGREVVVAEAASRIGTGTSSRNSEVIHAGIHYPRDSLKARLCVRGRDLLYDYCRERGIGHRRCGKLLVATDEGQLAALTSILATARDNGVTDLRLCDPGEIAALEPRIRCLGGLFSPSTGIVDSHGLMESLRTDSEARGAVFVFNTRVIGGVLPDGSSAARIRFQEEGGGAYEASCRSVINCAGLQAQEVASSLRGFPSGSVPPLYLSKGNYFLLNGRSPFERLVYPVPEEGVLGIHSTIDLGGASRFGPDQQHVSTIDYDVDPSRAGRFYASIRKYFPDLQDGSLSPGFSGIRPKIHAPGTAVADFAIVGPRAHGREGIVCLFGIESPGLTACLAIAEEVQRLLQQ